jgi:hypothetical protein
MDKTVRLLLDQQIEGLQYKCNQVVEMAPALAKGLVANALADDSKAGIDYCINDLGAKVIVHESEKDRAAKADLSAALQKQADAKTALKKETDAEKRATLSQQLADADAAVAALQPDAGKQ